MLIMYCSIRIGKGMNSTLSAGISNIAIINNTKGVVKAENILKVPSNVEYLIISVKGRK